MSTIAHPSVLRLPRPMPHARDDFAQPAVAVGIVPGDGVGPELARAVRRVVDASGARVAWQEIRGARRDGRVPADGVDAVAGTGAVLLAPITREERERLQAHVGTFASVRHVRELPGVWTAHTGRDTDLLIVHDHGDERAPTAERMPTSTVAQRRRTVTRAGCERIARFAFRLAEDAGRARITCAVDADALPLTDGMLMRAFAEESARHPRLDAEAQPVDRVVRRLVQRPETLDVVLASSSHGDVIGEVATSLVGGTAIVPTAAIGPDVAIFHAAHGTLPHLAGRDLASPIALLLAATMLLRHVGQGDAADRMDDALLATLRAGLRTRDLGDGPLCLGTTAFTDAVIEQLEDAASRDALAVPRWRARRRAVGRLRLLHAESRLPSSPTPARRRTHERTVGFDALLDSEWPTGRLVEALAGMTAETPLVLAAVWRGTAQVHPERGAAAPASDDLTEPLHCRFLTRDGEELRDAALITVLDRISLAFRWAHVERLREYDDVPGFTPADRA